MAIYQIDPITDPRWLELLEQHPDSSVFHSPAWLKSLRDTYGYRVFALTNAAPGQPMRNGLVFSEVASWMTGSRIVSLPFSDHCQPLVESADEFAALWSRLEARASLRGCRYVELRPMRACTPTAPKRLHESATFCFHLLDLQPDVAVLYRNLHKSCIQRKVDRAEREGIRIVHGQSEELLDVFYRLLLLTRRRHCLPPQPRIWFQNLVHHFGNDLKFWVAWQDDHALAAILTLASPHSVVYKYGASDAQFHQLGAMPALFWSAILYAKSRNAKVFDLGRSDSDNPGLIQFKDRLGAEQMNLMYLRSAPKAKSAQPHGKAGPTLGSVREQLTKQVLAYLPDFCLTAAGRLLYRHMG